MWNAKEFSQIVFVNNNNCQQLFFCRFSYFLFLQFFLVIYVTVSRKIFNKLSSAVTAQEIEFFFAETKKRWRKHNDKKVVGTNGPSYGLVVFFCFCTLIDAKF